jgi:hypothetical protein
MTHRRRCREKFLCRSPAVFAALFACLGVASAQDSELETVEVEGSRAEVRKEIQTFVSTVTRLDGDLVSRWREPLCPFVAADAPVQGSDLRYRLLQIAAAVPIRVASNKKCRPNLFIVVTNDAEEFVSTWRERDPGMFRWKPRNGVARSGDAGPVRTWHNARIQNSDGAPVVSTGKQPPRMKMKASRIVSTVSENISAAVVLVDTSKTGHATLGQLADYVAMVSFAKVDPDADLRGTATILRLFAVSDQHQPPQGLTEWDYAFLHGLYRQSYEALRQRGAIASRMVQELAPR